MAFAGSLRVSSDNLWNEAVATLGEEITSHIDFDQQKQESLNKLLELTETARRQSLDKAWSFTPKNGEQVIVRDVLAKLVKWVNHFKEVGDIVVQYDPIHAALPWAGVRFLLNVAVGDMNTYSSLVEKTASIAESICRNALVEDILKGSSSSTAEELRHALVKLYAKILTYLTQARTYYRQNTVKRTIKHRISNTSHLESSFIAISEAQKDVDHCCRIFNLQSQLEIQVNLKMMHEKFDAPIVRWTSSLIDIKDNLDTTTKAKILDWISVEPHAKHHRQTRDDILEGTGQWLLEDKTFSKWKDESASSILWLHGIPGSGKSKLASIVIEDAKRAFQRNQGPALAYFYCSQNRGEPGRSDPARITASITRQLSMPKQGGALIEAAIQVHEKRQADDELSSPLTLTESKSLITSLLGHYKDTAVTIVIDALDECDKTTRGDLVTTLEYLLTESPCLLKIFVSSRDDQDIVYKLCRYPTLDLSSNRNAADIDTFVRWKTRRLIENGKLLRDSAKMKELEEKINDKLTSSVHGMFRWASLQLDELCEQHTDSAIEERIGKLPKTLEELYEEIHSRIEKYDSNADRQYAQNALSWLLCSRRTLKSEELLAAVCSRVGSPIPKGQLLDLCCNLVLYDSNVNTFRLSHFSVREFLEKKTNELGEFLSGEDNAKSRFSGWSRSLKRLRRCVAILDLTTRLKFQVIMSAPPSALLVVCVFDIHNLIDQEHWGSLKKKLPRVLESMSYSELLAEFGSIRVLRWCLNNDTDFKITRKLMKAAAGNYGIGKHVMALLLEKRDSEIQITQDVVKAAAGNEGSGKDVMALLPEKRGSEIQITQDVVKAAARNRRDPDHPRCRQGRSRERMER
ncbi:uncharacterized protein BCR38DRAFT_455710 [Pseudomassariella vexata]|uniref:Uncharacterized protein n=1 Tax=Pseudomassariella vexata TaxID=1141098 RepID=A0A1Y2EBE1_9PEZI|nr:uncharacterized protein BCR38DRAFT_455710 [Pseudomassariella vexata]ORY68872.1 hypothetical protein BCR38DRAFT_455710 [Pseudomassariella vexata]